jgi:hypothetical protein
MQNNLLRRILTLDLPVNDSFSISDKRLRSTSLSTSLQRRDLRRVFYRFRSVDPKFCKHSSHPSCMLYTPPTSPFSSYSCLYCMLIPGGGDIFPTRPDRPWGAPSLLYNGYRVSSPVVKRPGRGVDHPPHLAY